MANSAPSILCISYEPALGQTRQWLLEKAGFSVTSALGLTEAVSQCRKAAFDLVLIGHSIPKGDRMALVIEIRKRKKSRIVSIHLHTEDPLPGMDGSVDAADGPETLLAAVRAALAEED
jgi:DNA-binding response OmpR family regulator